jgi:hypothetical protein
MFWRKTVPSLPRVRVTLPRCSKCRTEAFIKVEVADASEECRTEYGPEYCKTCREWTKHDIWVLVVTSWRRTTPVKRTRP